METPKRKYTKKDGYTISVVYFLRKEKESDFETITNLAFRHLVGDSAPVEVPGYPIYVRVTFLGKTVSLRSRLTVKVPAEEYDSYMNLEETIRFIKVERATIIATVKLFNSEVNHDFKISEWSSFYNGLNISLFSCIQKFLSEELKKILHNYPATSLYPDCIRVLTGGLQALPFLSSLDFKPANQLLEQYSTLFRMLSIDKSNYLDVTFTQPYYSVWDWKIGSLQSILSEENNPFLPEAEPLLDHILSIVTLSMNMH